MPTTVDELRTYFAYLAGQSGMDSSGLGEHIERCIARGFADFWFAHTWFFRDDVYTLTSDGSASYSMPENFDGVRSVRQTSSTYGGDVAVISKEAFDLKVPKPSSHPTGFPTMCSFYQDNGTWKMVMFPICPSGYTMIIDMVTSGEAEIGSVPDSHVGGLMACIEKYIYKLGSNERIHAQQFSAAELARLSAIEGVYKGSQPVMKDDTSGAMGGPMVWEKL